MDETPDGPVAKFFADLAGCGIDAAVNGPAVVYSVTAIGGARAGNVVPTAVSVSELSAWPSVAPHWLHFPDDVTFATSNPDHVECLDGWTRHSRDVGAWSMDRPPIANWLAHIRGVLNEVVS